MCYAGVNAHLYPSPMRHESRMLKISRSLADAGLFARICLIGISDATDGHEERERLDDTREIWRLPTGIRGRYETIGKAGRMIGWWRSVWRNLSREDVRCINAHSLSVLPLGVLLKFRHRARLIYDTHELETETASSRGIRRRIGRVVERVLLHFVDETCVVNDAIADWYRRQYRLPHVHVVKNVPYRQSTSRSTSPSPLRESLGIADDHLVFLYQGIIGDGRGVDMLIKAFAAQAADRHLVFMGYGARSEDVITAANRHPNVHYLPAVTPDVLSSYTSGADVGLAIIENISLSYYYCLPNKIFEYLASGLPVIATDLPCMRELVESEGCGWLVPQDAEMLARVVRCITHEDVCRLRPRAFSVQSRYAWQLEEPALLAMYDHACEPNSARSKSRL
jgi:glycosyltransferase involved in cell wall biosynthesis